MWCSASDTHLKELDRVVSGVRFLTGGVFECDLVHRQSVAVLCMLYKLMCNPMHPLYGALPVSYVRVNSGSTRLCDRTSVHSCLAKVLHPCLCSTDFGFSSFLLQDGIVTLGSLD